MVADGKKHSEIAEWLATRGVAMSRPSVTKWIGRNIDASARPAPRSDIERTPTPATPVVAREASKALTPEVVERSGSLAEIRDRLIALGDNPNATKPQVDALAWAGKIELGRMMVDP